MAALWSCVLCLLVFTHNTGAARLDTQGYLGCFYDDSDDPDLRGTSLTYQANTMTADGCKAVCMGEGYPYSGLAAGHTCQCGTTYGKHGEATGNDEPVSCSYLCNGDTEHCGGDSANSVYYSVSTDDADVATRELIAYSQELSFNDARKECVKGSGDLASVSVVDMQDLEQLKALLADVGVQQGEFWLGLRKSPSPTNGFEWTDHVTEAFVANDNTAGFWESGQPAQDDCVAVDITSLKWKTKNCESNTLPFVCNQQPISSDNSGGEGSSGDTSDDSSSSNLMALLIVLPIFAFCYGGSCLLYCIYKIYKNFKSRKNNSFLVKEDRFNSLDGPADPGPVIKPRPHPHSNKGFADEPAPESVPVTPVRASFDIAVIGTPSPPPGSGHQQDRKNLRKQLLLERAAQEARERRRQTPDPEGPATPPAAKPQPPSHRSSWRNKSRAPDYEVPMEEGQKSPGQKSEDSSSALIPDDNPQAMSIADILRVKRMMKETRNKRQIQAT